MSRKLTRYERRIGLALGITTVAVAAAGALTLVDMRPCKMRELDSYKIAAAKLSVESGNYFVL